MLPSLFSPWVPSPWPCRFREARAAITCSTRPARPSPGPRRRPAPCGPVRRESCLRPPQRYRRGPHAMQPRPSAARSMANRNADPDLVSAPSPERRRLPANQSRSWQTGEATSGSHLAEGQYRSRHAGISPAGRPGGDHDRRIHRDRSETTRSSSHDVYR